MMKYGFLAIPVMAMAAAAALVGGCGGSYSGVQAIAPASQDQTAGVAPSTGEYTLYRATGFSENYDTHVEPVWTLSVSQGQKLGFSWVTDETHRWDPEGAYHLVAYAGGQSRDLGAFKKRDVKFVWAGAKADVNGYFKNKGVGETIQTLTLH